MEKSKEELIQELNDLSEHEEQNKKRMQEIAKVLVAKYYSYGKKKNLSDKK